MGNWGKLIVIIVVGIVLIIGGIVKLFRLKARPELRKSIYKVIALGVGFVLFGLFYFYSSMMEQGILENQTQTPVWQLIQYGIWIVFGGIMIAAGEFIREKRVTGNGWTDMTVKGRVIGKDTYRVAPGYGRLIIEYQDPYDGERHTYQLSQNLKLKKHPVGSEYTLCYSRTEHAAYDVRSNRNDRKLELFLKITGGAVCVMALLLIGGELLEKMGLL